jgi:hypothetical protein
MKTTLLRHSLAARIASAIVLGFALTVPRAVVAQPPADSTSEDETPGRVVIERLGEPDSDPSAPAESEGTLPEVTVTAPFRHRRPRRLDVRLAVPSR